MSNPNLISLDAQLLTDLQRYFARQPAKHYPTEQLLDYLAGIDHAPRATFDQGKGKAITARHLARLLQPYGIVSKTIRISATATPKCYRVADFKEAFAKVVADRSPVVAANVADNVVDKIDVSDNVLDVADNVLDATRHQIHQLGEHLTRGYEATGNPFSHASSSEIQQWRDLADLMRKAAESIDSFTVTTRPTLTLIQGGKSSVADSDVAALMAADAVAAIAARKRRMTAPVQPPVQAKKSQWPPPKGWVWNHQTECYEPPKPKVQPDPSVIRQPIEMSPNLKYQPGRGLIAIDPQETA
ncbi:MAG: hypothetical protein QG599_880 [Pseudomonadota bacterium]|nr:hypothetical protein [Pseudomonadota bacterium]